MALAQALLVTRSVKGKVWTIIPEDGTSLAAAAGKFRAFEIGSPLAGAPLHWPVQGLRGWRSPPPFALLGLHVGLWQGLLVTRSV